MIDHQTDLQIIALRKQYMKFAQNYDLQKPVWIGDAYYQFRLETLFGGKLQVYLPIQFTDMSDSDAREKYPSRNRPQIIKSNEDTTVNFTFSYIGESGFPMTAQSTWKEIERLFPRNVLYDRGSIKKETLEIFWLEYKSFSMDTEVYNILFPVINSDTGIVLCTFNCPLASFDIWKPCVLKVIESIRGEYDDATDRKDREDTNERV